MAESMIISFVSITKNKYTAITTKRSNTLYFLTDTKEIYKGNIPFTESASAVTELPIEGVGKGKILIKPDFSGYIWDEVNSKWIQVISSVLEELNDTDDFTGKLISGKAIKDYIATKIDEEVASGNINTDNIKLSEDITIKGQTLGGYSDGTVIPKDTLLTDYIKGISMKRIAATYTQPTIELGVATVTVEAGTDMIDLTILPVFTQNDAGALNNYKLEEYYGVDHASNVELVNTTVVQSYIGTWQISDNIDMAFKSTASYDEGIIKEDNLGITSPIGHIMVGNVSDIVTYYGIRKGFSAAEAGPVVACSTTDEVRSLISTTGAATEGVARFVINCNTGDTRVTVAYPATLKDITSVVSKALGYNVGGNFKKTTVQVEGANGFTAIEYKVFTYIPTVPFPTNDTYTVNL